MNKILKTGTLLLALAFFYPSTSLAEEVKPMPYAQQPNAVREGDFKTLKEYEAFKAAQGVVKKMGVPEIRNGEIKKDVIELNGDRRDIRGDVRDIKNATNTADRIGAVKNLRDDNAEFRRDRDEMMRDVQERMRLGEKDRMDRLEGEKKAFMEKMNARRDEFNQKFEERKNSLKEKLKAKFGEKAQEKSENISKSAENALANFTKHIEKLNEVASKIEAEIGGLSQAGKDVTELSAMLVEARVSVSTAENSLTEFQAAYQAMTSAADPKSAFATVKDAGKKVADAIRSAHKSLMDMIPQIRSLKGENQATSTQATTN